MANFLRIIYAVLAITLGFVFSVQADPSDSARLEACIKDSELRHGIVPGLLKAIGQQESELNPSAVNKSNKDGSADHGAFQINDFWLPTLSKYGITKERLYDGCTSAYVAGWILQQEIARHGNNWRAVGAYNARKEKKRLEYARTIQARFAKIVNTPGR